jgi:hypothetical protein
MARFTPPGANHPLSRR